MDLARIFRVQSIPALIIIESETAKIVTSSGRPWVMDDPLGSWFPWCIREINEILSEMSLVSSDEKKVPYDSISSKIKCFYFSAHWVNISIYLKKENRIDKIVNDVIVSKIKKIIFN